MENQKNNMTDKKTGADQANRGTDPGMKTHGIDAGKIGYSNSESRGSASGTAGGTADSFIDVAKTTAGDAYDAVAGKASSALDHKKTDLSVGLVGVADTVRRVGEAIKDSESTNTVTQYASNYSDTAAQKLEQVAEYFESSDLKRMTRDVESYARRHPAIFMGAAFAAGLLASRFIKSSPPSDPLTTGAARRRSNFAGPADGVATGVGA
jgi:hypothetical protein